jgi:glycosyltransferase involved in cell wall biosynthesis
MKSQNILISIGMPIYNGAEFLEQAITSVLSQSFTNIELIIADDCSTDNSEQIYKKFAEKDSRIRIFKHKKNIGSIPNFNFVLKQAKGEYFMWAAQDDYREKNTLEKLLKLHKKFPDAALAVSKFLNVYGEKKYEVYPDVNYDNSNTKANTLISFLKTDNLSFFYGLHKTNILKKTGGYFVDSRPLFKSSDFLTIYNVLLEGKLVYTSEILFYKRDTGFFTIQFDILANREFSQQLFKKIYRYSLFPFIYIYDFIYGTIFLIKANFSITEKIQIEFWLIINILKKVGLFILNILIGILSFLKGLFSKLL